MRFKHAALPVALVLFCSTAGFAALRPRTAQGEEGGSPAAPITKEHKLLTEGMGEFDAKVSIFMMPGQPPMVSKGSESRRMLNDRWTVSEFRSEWMDMPFSGMGVMGFDPEKKKFVSYWFDSMSNQANVSEGSYDDATKTYTMMGETRDMMGANVRQKEVIRVESADAAVFQMFHQPASGDERMVMQIDYTRKK